MLQAYLVYKYRDKEQPTTTMRGNSKYSAAPKTATCSSFLNSSTHNATSATAAAAAAAGEKPCDNDYELNSRNSLEKDVQVLC